MASQGDGFKRTLTLKEWATGMWLAAKYVTDSMVDIHPEGPEAYPEEVLHLLHLANYDLVSHLDRRGAVPQEDIPSPTRKELHQLQDACNVLLVAVDRPGGSGKLKGDHVLLFCSGLVKAMMGDRPLSEEQVGRGASLLVQECQGALTPETAVGLVMGLVTERCIGLGDSRAIKAFVTNVCEKLREEAGKLKEQNPRTNACAKCGNIYAPDADYCRKCGAQRPGASAKTPLRRPSPAGVSPGFSPVAAPRWRR